MPRKLQLKESDNVQEGEYDAATLALTLTFKKNGAKYRYNPVKPETAHELEQAESPGVFVHGFLIPAVKAGSITGVKV